MKTGKQIQGDIMNLLRGSQLEAELTGGIYRNGYRPKDSKLEDAVVIFDTGLSEQIETGIVTVDIYFPDIQIGNGAWVEDGKRGEELETAAAEWVAGLNQQGTNYHFSLNMTIYTEEEPSIHQHFVVVKLAFKHFA